MQARHEWTPQKDDSTKDDGDTGHSRSGGGSLRRRLRSSDAASDWSVSEAMVLVNEISVVEGDCSTQVSSYQKWKIVAENCRAFGVFRASNQCSRKWEALLLDYATISRWQSLNPDSYWSLDVESRMELGLPRVFDCDLFKAIHQLVLAREEHSDDDTDQSDLHPHPHPHQLPPPYSVSKKPKQPQVRPPSAISMEKLYQNAEQINVLVRAWPTEARDTSQIDLVRRQGDELISYLRDMANNLGQLCDLVRGC